MRPIIAPDSLDSAIFTYRHQYPPQPPTFIPIFSIFLISVHTYSCFLGVSYTWRRSFMRSLAPFLFRIRPILTLCNRNILFTPLFFATREKFRGKVFRQYIQSSSKNKLEHRIIWRVTICNVMCVESLIYLYQIIYWWRALIISRDGKSVIAVTHNGKPHVVFVASSNIPMTEMSCQMDDRMERQTIIRMEKRGEKVPPNCRP